MPCAIVCAALGCVFLRAPHPDATLGPQNPEAHRYSAYDPPWTQIAFPRLGSTAAPPSSVTAIATRVVRAIPVGSGVQRLAWFASLAHVLALALFWAVLLQLGVAPILAAIATAVLGFEPAFFASATMWTPYVMLPALVMGALVAHARSTATRSTGSGVVLGAIALCIIAESVYATALLLPLMWGLGKSMSGRQGQRSWKLPAVVAAVLLVALFLQIIGAAAAWRDASALAGGPAASWRDALVAVTTRWNRVVEIYVTAPVPRHIVERLRDGVEHVGLLGVVLAVVGAVVLARRRHPAARVLLSFTIVAILIEGWLAPPVSAVLPSRVPLVALMVLLATVGLAEMASAFTSPAPVVIFFAGVLAAHGWAAQRLNALTPGSTGPATLDAVLRAVPRPASIVAGDVERDGRFESFMAVAPEADRIVRIPHTPGAIRRAKALGSRVFVWPGEVTRIASLGWMLAPHHDSDIAALANALLYEVIEAMPCAPSSGDGWFDVSGPAQAGAVSLQTDRASRFEVEIEAEGLAGVVVHAEDVLTSTVLNVIRQDPQHIRVAVERRRPALPVIQFDTVPPWARARISGSEPGPSVRVCGAPVSGGRVSVPSSGGFVPLPLDSAAIFTQGWHPAEPADASGRLFRWSGTTSATLRLQLAGAPTSLEIAVDAAPAVPASYSPTVTLEINGHSLGSRPMSAGPTTYTWFAARDVLRGGLNVFRLEVPEVVSPKVLGRGDDTRAMGLALTSFRLRRIGG